MPSAKSLSRPGRRLAETTSLTKMRVQLTGVQHQVYGNHMGHTSKQFKDGDLARLNQTKMHWTIVFGVATVC